MIQVCPPEVKDGHYYLRIVNEEQSRLETLSMAANKDMEKELSEEGKRERYWNVMIQLFCIAFIFHFLLIFP